MDKTKFWDSNYYNHPPITLDMICFAEKQLNVKLPESLIELLKIQNGGYTNEFGYPMTQPTTWANNHVPLTELFGIVTDESVNTAQNILQSAYMTEEWGLPNDQVLLSGDGHWWITLDYRNNPVPTVRWIDVECNEDIQIAASFDEFIAGLKPLEDFDI
jgi:hypothetical protein